MERGRPGQQPWGMTRQLGGVKILLPVAGLIRCATDCFADVTRHVAADVSAALGIW